MAFQEGQFLISGKLGNVVFYHSRFGWLVRKRAGPSRHQIMRSPAFVRTRENIAEFARCGALAATIKRLVYNKTVIRDAALHNRLVKMMHQLKKADRASLAGERDPAKAMFTPEGLTIIRSFELAGGHSLEMILTEAGYLPVSVPELPAEGNSPAANTALAAKAEAPARRKNRKIRRHLYVPRVLDRVHTERAIDLKHLVVASRLQRAPP